MRKKLSIVSALAIGALSLTACASTRQIDPAETGSFRIEGTSWYGFCQGRNAFIWIPSKTDSDPDELEAVVYDDYRCVGKIDAAHPAPSSSDKPDADPDGIIDDDED